MALAELSSRTWNANKFLEAKRIFDSLAEGLTKPPTNKDNINMEQFEVKLKVNTNLVGGTWETTIDLVEDFGFDEEEARDFIANDFFGNNEIEQCLQEHALQMCGFEWGVSR